MHLQALALLLGTYALGQAVYAADNNEYLTEQQKCNKMKSNLKCLVAIGMR